MLRPILRFNPLLRDWSDYDDLLGRSGITFLEAHGLIGIDGIWYKAVLNHENLLETRGLCSNPTSQFLITEYNAGLKAHVSKEDLISFRTNLLEKVDVWQPVFTDTFIVCAQNPSSSPLSPDVCEELERWGVVNLLFFHQDTLGEHSCSGPYVYVYGRTYQPWRNLKDNHEAFMTSCKLPPIYSLEQDIFDTSYAPGGFDWPCEVIPVPSRCYSNPTTHKPLDGLRIAVKDNIDIEAFKTTLCNRAWTDLYPRARTHAVCIQKFLKAGSILLGKTKLQPMIVHEEPSEAVEVTAPFNPRADLYQHPSGSSHGSAVAVGAYEWCDAALGSDTNGGGRKPASYNGCFSIRPRTEAVNAEGVVRHFPEFDVPVVLIAIWKSLGKWWRCDYLPTVNAAQSALIDKFASGLERAFGIWRIHVSLTALWARDCPATPDGADDADLAGSYTYYYDAYYALEGFRNDYMAKYDKPPFVHSAMLWQWNIAKTITKEQRDAYWSRCKLYRKWLLERIFCAGEDDVVTVMVMPIEDGKQNFRLQRPLYARPELDILPWLTVQRPFSVLSGYAPLYMAPIPRGPEVTAPVGDIPYKSIFTKREEGLPVAVSVLGAPSMDMVVLDIVRRGMEKAGIPLEVKAGTKMY